MNSFRLITYLIVFGIFCGCAPRVIGKLQNNKYEPLTENFSINVLDINDEVPVNSEYIKDIKVGYSVNSVNSGHSTDCSYKKVMSTAKGITRSAGGNILKVTQFKNPLGGACFQLQGKIYRNLDSASLKNIQARFELRNKSTLPKNADYAIVHFYRPNGGPGLLLGYNIKTSHDSIIGRMESGSYFDFKTKNFGLHTFYGTLETKETLTIDIKQGEEYYVQCKVKYGVAFGRPMINLVENILGRLQYEKLK